MEDWLKLNVGGQVFLTTKSTILTSAPESMLAAMFLNRSGRKPAVQDDQSSFLIDRNPDYFKIILNFLRTRQVILEHFSAQGVLLEAEYFGIDDMIPILKEVIHKNSHDKHSGQL
jgi:hypothetical protein